MIAAMTEQGMTGDKLHYKFFSSLCGLEGGLLELTTPEGRTRVFGDGKAGMQAPVRMVIRDWRVISNLAVHGEHGLVEDYRAGRWDTSDLSGLLTLGLRNDHRLGRFVSGSRLVQALWRLCYLSRRNSPRGSRRNVHAHYDLGNDFYALWLDPTLTYSSALYAHPDQPLVQAQHHKYDRLLERLEQRPGELLELGCGWGGFAEHALQRHDCRITGVTLSREQHTHAARRLQGSADIQLRDYRSLAGRYDNIVSIEMFEAVGERYWPLYFRKLAKLLRVRGKALLQTITIEDAHFDAYRRGNDMIRSYIFPGGMLPSPSRFRQEVARAGLRLNDEYHFGADYAATLRQWLANFEARLPAIRKLGYDDSFIRLWRFYLAACIAGFETGRTSVMQVELQHS